MEMHPKQSELAVIIPTYNRANSVGRTIESVLAAALPTVEIVVVDDGSTDRTPEVLAQYCQQGVKIIRLAHREGGNHARNVGAAASDAQLLAFLDSDDIFDASRPMRLIEFYRTNPEIDAVLDSFVVSCRGAESDALQPRGCFDHDKLVGLLITHAIPLTNSSVSVRRNAFDSIGGFDRTLNRQQDRDFLLRLSAKAKIFLGSAKDVLKTQSTDSISRQGLDSISALAAIVERHPQFLAPQYRDLLKYLAVRGILKSLGAGDVVNVWREISSLSKSKTLPRSFWECLLHYRSGKKIRSDARRVVYSKSSTPFSVGSEL